MKAKILIPTLLLLLALALTGCGQPPQMEDIDFSPVTLEQCTDTDKVTDHIKLTVKDYGSIIIRLYPEVAPLTVEQIQGLVKDGFYNGKTFHRVMPDFMIQGGSVDGAGMSPGQATVKGEFSANGVENNLKHARGVVSLARAQDMNSGSGQFFIMHADRMGAYFGLDGNYAAFGYVVCGMEVVDAITGCERGYTDRGEKSVPLEYIIIESMGFVDVN